MKILQPLMCAALIAASGTSALAQAPASPDSDFLTQVQQQMLGFYALGTVGSSHAQSSTLKSLASTLATEANGANAKIRDLAKAHNVSLPNAPSTRADAQYSDVQTLKGSEFDSRFKQDMTVDLSFAEDTLSTEAQSGSSADLKAFAKAELAKIKAAESTLSK